MLSYPALLWHMFFGEGGSFGNELCIKGSSHLYSSRQKSELQRYNSRMQRTSENSLLLYRAMTLL
jgi:hypothetical protein